jgi:SNF2 family DNA or RNA helicase
LGVKAFGTSEGDSRAFPVQAWERYVELFGGTRVPVKSLGKWAKPGRVVGDEEPTVLKWTIASPQVRERLKSVMLRRKREDVLPDLPTKTYQTLPAELDRATAKLCDELLGLLRDGETSEALYERLGGDATFERISSLLEQLSTAKIPSMLEHVKRFEEEEEPLVVFAAHRRPIEALKMRPGWTTILGGDSAEDRASKVAGFMSRKYRGIAGTIQAMGTSVTLTRASKALFVSRLWTPELNAQGEDRVCRIGQDRGVVIYDLESEHPLDARLGEVLREKTRLVRSVL